MLELDRPDVWLSMFGLWLFKYNLKEGLMSTCCGGESSYNASRVATAVGLHFSLMSGRWWGPINAI